MYKDKKNYIYNLFINIFDIESILYEQNHI